MTGRFGDKEVAMHGLVIIVVGVNVIFGGSGIGSSQKDVIKPIIAGGEGGG